MVKLKKRARKKRARKKRALKKRAFIEKLFKSFVCHPEALFDLSIDLDNLKR